MNSSALKRKQMSEEILRKEGIPFIAHLPIIEDEETAQVREIEEIARRAMALNVVAVKGEGLEQERVLEIVEQYNLSNAFSPKELKFIQNENPSQQELVNFIWRYESYWVLLWALNYVEELSHPDQICDVVRAVRIMVDRTAEEFVKDSKLRNASEIFDAADLIYRYDWACVDARINGRPTPAKLDASVVYERHYALNWLIGYPENADWDEVSTDT